MNFDFEISKADLKLKKDVKSQVIHPSIATVFWGDIHVALIFLL